MSTTSESQEEIHHLFRKHVDAIATGTVEIVSIARDVGRQCYVAVRSHDPKVSAIQACAGDRGALLKAMVAELNREFITLVQWDKSAERFIASALGPFGLACSVALDPLTSTASVTIDWDFMDQFGKKGFAMREAINVNLASELTGWKIAIVENKNSEKAPSVDLSERRIGISSVPNFNSYSMSHFVNPESRCISLPTGCMNLTDVLKQLPPSLDIKVAIIKEGFMVTTWLPGLRCENLNIAVKKNTIRIVARKAESPAPLEGVIEVPAGYNLVNVRAEYSKGELRIIVPKL